MFKSDSKLASHQRETDLIKKFASAGHIFILLTYYNYNSTGHDLRYMFIIFNSLDMK